MEKIDVKILFVDIDWTILDHNTEEFDLVSIDALKKAQENGYLVYIATARPYQSVEALNLFKYITPNGLITSNGSLIFVNDELIYGVEIPKEVVKNIVKVVNKHHMNIEMVGEKTRYRVNKYDKYFTALYETFLDTFPEHHIYDGKEIYTMMVTGPDKWDEEIFAQMDKNMFHYRFSEYGMDISFSPTQKGHAIEKVLKYLNISKDNAISIGDSDLDLTMFENTKYSIAVGNAKDHIKEKATYVTDAVYEHGVANILKELISI